MAPSPTDDWFARRTDRDTHLVPGLLGPLLQVPLVALHFPHLAGLVQPPSHLTEEAR